MDGNGRWAENKGKSRINGHIEGINSVRTIITCAKNLGIKYLTLYAFSTENWKRPEKEVNGLMSLFQIFLKKERKMLMKEDVSLKILGRKQGLSDKILKLIDESEIYLSNNNSLQLNIAFNYGGRSEIVDAVNLLLAEKKESITEEDICSKLYNPDLPDPELVIRTGGEYRVSNFLLWQIAYSEFYITNTLWPDFKENEFNLAIDNYLNRERRMGGLKQNEK